MEKHTSLNLLIYFISLMFISMT